MIILHNKETLRIWHRRDNLLFPDRYSDMLDIAQLATISEHLESYCPQEACVLFKNHTDLLKIKDQLIKNGISPSKESSNASV